MVARPGRTVGLLGVATLFGAALLPLVTRAKPQGPSASTSRAVDAAPVDTAPADTAPADTAPADTAPADTAPAARPDKGEPRYFPFLADEPSNVSVSVGNTSYGHLVGGRGVSESEALAILPKQRKRQLQFGSSELVALLEEVAKKLHKATKTKLWLGNLARRGGGDISYSVSHNSGRDADIAFCYRDRKGQPVDPPDLVPLNGQGVSKARGLRFDPARSWLVVKALLESKKAQVQYLFLSGNLKRQLLLHAKKKGEGAALINRAATVLRQPGGGTSPHNDHLHLRIYCGERDVLGGCLNTGVVHPWAKLHDKAKRQRIAKVGTFLDHVHAQQRRRSLERLVLLDARKSIGPVLSRLEDRAPAVRQAAVRAVAALGAPRHIERLDALFRDETEPAVRISTIEAVGALGGKAAGRFLSRAIGEPELDLAGIVPALELAAEVRGGELFGALPELTRGLWRSLDSPTWQLPSFELNDQALLARLRADHQTKLVALEAVATSERLEPAKALLALLEDRNSEVRQAAARALRMTTNFGYGVKFGSEDRERRARGLKLWRSAVQRSRTAPRDAWLVTGFLGVGYKVRELHTKHAWELVRAVAAGEHLSYNAQRVLMRLFDYRPPSLDWSRKDACRHWLRWLKQRRKHFQLAKPPKKAHRACY